MTDLSQQFEEQLLFTLNEADFVAWPQQGKHISNNDAEFELAFVFRIERGLQSLSGSLLHEIVQQAARSDDVFRHEFLSVVVLWLEDGQSLALEHDVERTFRDWGTIRHLFASAGAVEHAGPHVVSHGRLAPAYRLYRDFGNTFVSSFRPGLETTKLPIRSMRAGHNMHQRCSIAVASHMAAKKTAGSPLRGLRIMVKDMYEIAGYKTGLGSRAFLELSKPGKSTAPAIQRLIDLGAAVVGTGQLCAMVGKTEPTQTIDHLAPFNPRADGFQSPSGGSSGQPSAVATYDWLDIAVGSDSTASGRLPAQANGCFSLRPTHGSVSIDGMWSGVPRFDTPCLFARGIGILRDVAECWLDTSSSHSSSNSSLTAIYILTDFLPLANQQQMQVFNNFVNDLESYSGRSVQRISIEECWMNHPPSKADGLALQSYLSPTVATRTYVYSIWQRIAAFRAAYLAQFDGTEPFLPAPKGIHVWDAARDVTTQQSEEAWQRLEVYKEWLMSHVLQVNGITNDNPIVVMPLENVTTRYRDEWPAPAKGDQQLWDSLLLAPILGAPEVVIPAGVVEYSSWISGKVEELPVCVSVLGMPGTDRELLSTIQRFLVAVGRPTTVKTGSRMF